MFMLRSFRYRLFPNPTQAAGLTDMLGSFCDLYNACLQQRIEAYRAVILGAVDAKVDITLVELAEMLRREHGASFAPSTVWRFLDRHGSPDNPLQGLSLDYTLAPALAVVRVETPARYISIRASSTLLSRRR